MQLPPKVSTYFPNYAAQHISSQLSPFFLILIRSSVLLSHCSEWLRDVVHGTPLQRIVFRKHDSVKSIVSI